MNALNQYGVIVKFWTKTALNPNNPQPWKLTGWLWGSHDLLQFITQDY